MGKRPICLTDVTNYICPYPNWVDTEDAEMTMLGSSEHLRPVRRMVPSWKYICLHCNKCQPQNLWHDKEKIVIFVSFLISSNLYLETISGQVSHILCKIIMQSQVSFEYGCKANNEISVIRCSSSHNVTSYHHAQSSSL